MTLPSLAVHAAPAYTPLNDRDITPRREAGEWSIAQLIGFRFALIYVLLYTFPGPLFEVPGLEVAATPYRTLWLKIVPWFGAHVLHLARPVSTRMSGSGDKLFDWIQMLVMLTVAVIGAVAWTAAARNKRSHPKLSEAFQIYLRFTLASILFVYGFDKIIPNQFEPMNPIRLTQYFGEAAPGGFAWAFLGSSVMYTIFAGAGETLAGLLLLFRRTTTLGAILGAAVLTNVFMLNMSYDIPVKQYAGHLLLMCAFLAAFDARRLLNVLVFQRTAEPRPRTELFTTPRALRTARTCGLAFGAWMIGGHLHRENKNLHQFGRLAPRGPVYGIFEVDEVVKNGAMQPALLTDATRWRRLSSTAHAAAVRFATDSLVRYRLQADSVAHIVTLTSADTANKAVLAYTFPDSMHLVLRGRIGGDSVEMKLTRRSEQSYLLVSRGFHWVNETPYFR